MKVQSVKIFKFLIFSLFRTLHQLYEIVSEIFYLYKTMCYTALIVIWLAIKVEPEVRGLALALPSIVIEILCIAIINEVMVQKVRAFSYKKREKL